MKLIILKDKFDVSDITILNINIKNIYFGGLIQYKNNPDTGESVISLFYILDKDNKIYGLCFPMSIEDLDSRVMINQYINSFANMIFIDINNKYTCFGLPKKKDKEYCLTTINNNKLFEIKLDFVSLLFITNTLKELCDINYVNPDTLNSINLMRKDEYKNIRLSYLTMSTIFIHKYNIEKTKNRCIIRILLDFETYKILFISSLDNKTTKSILKRSKKSKYYDSSLNSFSKYCLSEEKTNTIYVMSDKTTYEYFSKNNFIFSYSVFTNHNLKTNLIIQETELNCFLQDLSNYLINEI